MAGKKDQQLRLRLRTERFDAETRSTFGVDTDAAVAERMDVHFTVLSQYRTGSRYCGAGFVATCRALLPHVPFEDLFEVVEVDARAGAA